jgi:hypothetical protein
MNYALVSQMEISPLRHGDTEKFCTDNQVSVSLCLCGEEEE